MILYSLKVVPYKILIDCKVERKQYRGETWQTLPSGINSNIIKNDRNQNWRWHHRMQWGAQDHPCDALAKNIWSESYHRKASEEIILKSILYYQNLLFKKFKVMKVKERLSNCSRLKKTNRHDNKCIHGFQQGLFAKTGTADKWQKLKRIWGLNNRMH